jgi:hypothetical protein
MENTTLKKTLILIAIGVLALALSGCMETGEEQTGDGEAGEVVAVVNGEEILRKEYEASIKSVVEGYQQQGVDMDSKEGKELINQAKQGVLDELIQHKILVQDAEKQGYEASEKDVDEQLDQIKEQFSTDEEFEAALEQYQITLDGLKEQISTQIKVEQYTAKEVGEITVTEEELEAFYEEFSKQSDDPPAYEEAKPQIEQHLKQQRTEEELQKIVEKLKEESDIEILI